MTKIRVRPRKKGLIVLDDLGRKIPYKEDGVEVNKTSMILRLIKKDGDLIDVDRAKPEAQPKQQFGKNNKRKGA